MSLFNESPERRVIPRWRRSSLTANTGELDSFQRRGVQTEHSSSSFDKRLGEWRSHQAVPFAADLVSAGLVLGREDETRDAAAFLLLPTSAAPLAAQRLAAKALRIEHLPATEEAREQIWHHRIATARAHLREFPRDPLRWVDLARFYTICGHEEKAFEAMRRGLALAPNDRFTLRSATRLYLHANRPGRALGILHSSSATAHDPWLLAAEIAASTVARQGSLFVRPARRLLESGKVSPWHLNELASALGTLALLDGNRRHARKLFLKALEAPSDNTVAQVQWALRKLPLFPFPDESLKAPRTYEARSWESYFAGRWDDALKAVELWLDDEPFSGRPAIMGTFLAAVPLDDHVKSARIAERGLLANPGNQSLRNNLVFALASGGRVDEALRAAELVKPSEFENRGGRIAWTATQGLLEFRQGRIEEGRKLYMAAIAGSEDDLVRRGYAAAFLAREEIVGRTGRAASALEFAKVAAQRVDSVALKHLIFKLEMLIP